jgi:hypothetical protein
MPATPRALIAVAGTLAIGVLVGILPVGRIPGPDFYATAAQIIPVLLVALSVERAARELWAVTPRWMRGYTFTALAASELCAILASSGVIAEAPDDAARPSQFVGPGLLGTYVLLGVTVLGLVAGFLSVMYLAFFARSHHASDAGR